MKVSGSDRSGAPRTWYDFSDLGPPYGPTDYGCNTQPSSCWSTAVVTGAQDISDFQDIFDVVETGAGQDIIDAFDLHETLLDKTIDNGIVDDVISGNVRVSSKGDFSTETAYLIFKDVYEAIIAVYPYER